ncbi:MAG TPA: hypothetical protein EYQ51_07635 [Alphaproteobacteria bacterium]|nr:hypothetical protein [Alphaproteobacteria bacterium]
MILIKVTNQGSFHFLMNDGRVGVSSPSGYVRINTKNTNHFTMEKQFYQINKVKKNLIEGKRDWYDRDLYSYERVLIPNPKKRYEYLLEFENKNC